MRFPAFLEHVHHKTQENPRKPYVFPHLFLCFPLDWPSFGTSNQHGTGRRDRAWWQRWSCPNWLAQRCRSPRCRGSIKEAMANRNDKEEEPLTWDEMRWDDVVDVMLVWLTIDIMGTWPRRTRRRRRKRKRWNKRKKKKKEEEEKNKKKNQKGSWDLHLLGNQWTLEHLETLSSHLLLPWRWWYPWKTNSNFGK